jgi:hypothetical protein
MLVAGWGVGIVSCLGRRGELGLPSGFVFFSVDVLVTFWVETGVVRGTNLAVAVPAKCRNDVAAISRYM